MNTAQSQLLIRNGLAGMIVALIGGFMLTFKMLGGISFSPLPFFIDHDLPGTVAGWRAVHLGMLLNGIMAIVLGLTLPRFVVSARAAKLIAAGILIAIWGNFCFYLFSMFGMNHGLTLGANRLGEGNWAGALAFMPALIGAVTLIAALIALVRAKQLP